MADKVTLYNINDFEPQEYIKVKHGHWIKVYDSFQCSVCGNKTTTYHRTEYCPNCGAKMDEVVGE